MLAQDMIATGWAPHDGVICPVDRETWVLLRCGIIARAIPGAEAWVHDVVARDEFSRTVHQRPTDIVGYISLRPQGKVT